METHCVYWMLLIKTTKYALPLFMLVVRTNMEYCAVAEFVTETESADAISEAISILKAWNPDWNPLFVMMDYCEADINARDSIPSSKSLHVCFSQRTILGEMV